MIGLGLGMNLIALYYYTQMPYNYVFFEDEIVESEKHYISNCKYKKTLIESQSGDYYVFDEAQRALSKVGHIGFFNNYQLQRKQFDVSPMR